MRLSDRAPTPAEHGTPPTATPPIEAQLVEALGRFATVWVRAVAAPSELSLTAASTLAALQRLGGCRLGELADRQGVRQPTMTELVSRLERAGMVRRQAASGDGRGVRVQITELGTRQLRTRQEQRAEHLRGALRRLPADQQAALAQAVAALDRLADLLQPTEGAPDAVH